MLVLTGKVLYWLDILLLNPGSAPLHLQKGCCHCVLDSCWHWSLKQSFQHWTHCCLQNWPCWHCCCWHWHHSLHWCLHNWSCFSSRPLWQAAGEGHAPWYSFWPWKTQTKISQCCSLISYPQNHGEKNIVLNLKGCQKCYKCT